MSNGLKGGQAGNDNASKNKVWTDAIRRAIARRGKTVEGGLNDLADTFINAVASGDAWALKELGDRLEGKPAQLLNVGGQEDNPLRMLEVAYIDAKNKED